MKKAALGVYAGIGILGILAFFGGVLGAYTRILGPGPGFGLFAVGMLISVFTVIAGFIDLTKNGSSWRTGVLVCALLPVASLIYGAVDGRKYPVLNDVSTNMDIPPAFVHAKKLEENAGRDMSFPLEFKPLIEQHYSDLEPQISTETIDDTHQRAISVINGLSTWEIGATDITSDKILIEGTITSEVFGFVDDYIIVLTRPGSGGCVVDMRSKSRMGKGDFGQNAAHIRQFFDLMDL